MADEQHDPRVVGSRQNQYISNYIDPSVAEMQLDMSRQIDFIEHDLKGEYLAFQQDEEGKQVPVWEASGMRMLNDKGVRFIVSQLHSYVQTNTILSNLNDHRIESIMTRLHMTLSGVLIDNKKEFEIADEYRYAIIGKVTDVIWMTLLRAKDGKTLDGFQKSTSTAEVREVKGERKKFFGLF